MGQLPKFNTENEDPADQLKQGLGINLWAHFHSVCAFHMSEIFKIKIMYHQHECHL